MEKEKISVNNLLEIINKKDEIIDRQSQEIIYLQEKLDYFVRQKFTSTSEKHPDNQANLFNFEDFDKNNIEVEEEPEFEKIEYTRRRKGGKKRPPESLPRVRVEHDISEEEKICSCGCEMQRIREITSEQYDIIPAKFQVIQNVRFVYACSCKCGEKLKTTPLAPQVLPKHQVTPSFLATIAVQKFEDALPLHRQARIYKKRFGVEFTTTTLSNWMIKTSQLRLTPVIEKLDTIMRKSTYIQADETTLQVLKEKDKEAKQKSYIWLRVRKDEKNPIVLMDYSSNRAKTTALSILDGFAGYLQTDGYQSYNIIANQEGVTHLGCWAHARRKFADIVKSGVSPQESKKYANQAVKLIRKLYKIETEIKDKPPNEKLTQRHEKSKPIIDEIKKWLDDNFFEAQKLGGTISKAFVYLNNQFSKLTVYLENGELSIDNNMAENHVRPIALGRKNWLFATSTKGAEALANWYSIIETAKANDVEPYHYLCHLLTQLPIYEKEGWDIDELLPWNVVLDGV